MKGCLLTLITIVIGFVSYAIILPILGFSLRPEDMAKYYVAPPGITFISLMIGIAIGRLSYIGLKKIIK